MKIKKYIYFKTNCRKMKSLEMINMCLLLKEVAIFLKIKIILNPS
jgi:hypothetical protein